MLSWNHGIIADKQSKSGSMYPNNLFYKISLVTV